MKTSKSIITIIITLIALNTNANPQLTLNRIEKGLKLIKTNTQVEKQKETERYAEYAKTLKRLKKNRIEYVVALDLEIWDKVYQEIYNKKLNIWIKQKNKAISISNKDLTKKDIAEIIQQKFTAKAQLKIKDASRKEALQKINKMYREKYAIEPVYRVVYK